MELPALRAVYFATLAALSWAVCSASSIQTTEAPLVAVSGGKLQGEALPSPGGAVFKGIPYAAPPVGDLRWRETRPARPWGGVKQAVAYQPGCGEVARRPEVAKANPGINPEDCLYLNVWTPAWPATGKKMAVIYWINGGELEGGSGEMRPGVESLVRHGVVLVSANYRGHLLGMMGHPELDQESAHRSSANYMVYDQIAVLKWIHDNITRFGGDPGNVTVMGQSGGAHATSMLVASPLTRGLIHRAIIHSGSPMQAVRPYLTHDELDQIGIVTAEILKAPATDQLKFLRGLPAADLVAAMRPVRTRLIQTHGGQAYDEGTDGYAIPQPTNEVWQSHQESPIPLMVGSTGVDSGSAPTGVGPLERNATPAQALAWEKLLLEKFYAREPDLLQRALQIYGLSPGPNEISTYAPYGTPVEQIGVDLNHRCSVGMTAAYHSAIAPTYQFEFNIATPGRPAAHTADLRYVFGYDDIESAALRKQSDIMQQYWTNFAKTGNPNGPGLPAWQKYAAATKPSMEFTNNGPIAKPQPRQAACAPYVEKYTRDPKRLSTGADLQVRGSGGAL
jgi:para-nitrobenzyl esterase